MNKREILDRLEDIYKYLQEAKLSRDYRAMKEWTSVSARLIRALMDDIR